MVGKRATKPEIIKAAAAALHHVQSPSPLDFPAGVVSACSVPLTIVPGLQGLALLCSKREEDAEMAGNWAQSSPLDQMGCQEIKGLADALGKEKGSVSGTVTGGV